MTTLWKTLVLAAIGLPAAAQTGGTAITIRDHAFSPARIEVAAGRKIALRVTNADPTAEEFDSPDLHREKIVPPGEAVVIFVGPLPPGTYAFIGEHHPATAHGEIVAK